MFTPRHTARATVLNLSADRSLLQGMAFAAAAFLAALGMSGCQTEIDSAQNETSSQEGFGTQTGALTVAPLSCATATPGAARGLWVWSTAVLTSTTERVKFFDFAKARSVRTVYLAAGNYISYKPEYINGFTAEAAANCIQVEILFGKHAWALSTGHAEAVTKLKEAIAAIKLMPVKPVGVHFDIEPHLLAGWSTNMDSYANQYLDLVNKLRYYANGAGLRLTMDVPFWYDGKTVVRSGVARKLSELIADRTDRLGIMDYRDTASEMIASVTNEVAYAAKTGKQVVLGAETMCDVSPSYITFCQEGRAALDEAFQAVKTQYAGTGALGEMAVHHYGTYQAM